LKVPLTLLYNPRLSPFLLQPFLVLENSVPDETTRLENSTYDILRALGKDADFLYDTVDTYINDAQKANRNDLVEMWTTIKNDRQRHLRMLRQELEKEAKQEKLSE
jgi:rubrerythrin